MNKPSCNSLHFSKPSLHDTPDVAAPAIAAHCSDPPETGHAHAAAGARQGMSGEHTVQFYESDDYLVDRVADFIVSGLLAGEVAMICATAPHLAAIEEKIRTQLDQQPGGAGVRQEDCILLDAETTLSNFMVDGWPDERRFNDVLDSAFQKLKGARDRRVRVFGEMVAVLCAQGKTDAAIQLERLWNNLIKHRAISLLCGYPMAAFSKAESGGSFESICALHSGIGHAEEASGLADDMATALAKLQQKTRALAHEIDRRNKIAQALSEREKTLLERTAALVDANEQLTSEIEKRRNSEQELRRTQHVLTSAQRIAQMGSWIMDVPTGDLDCSDEFYRIFGLEPGSVHLSLEYCLKAVHPDDRETTRQTVATTLEKKQDYSGEKRIVRPDGSVRYISSKAKVILDEKQECVALIGAIMDITERKLAEQALSRSEARFRSLLDLSSDCYWEQDEEQRFTEVSEPGLRKFNLRAESILGLAPWEAANFHPGEAVRAKLREDIAARRAFRDVEYCIVDVDGATRYLHISGEPVFDDAGKFTGYRGVGKDITERKQAQQALAQSRDNLRRLAAHQHKIKERERQRIAREVHDELGGLLTGLKAYITVSMERGERAGLPADHLLRKAATFADKGIDSVRRIVTDLRPSVLDQLGVWAALEWQADQIMERTGLTCHCTITPEAASVRLDAERATMLFRVVQEALTNVVRHAQASKVRIAVSRPEDRVVIEIQDDGIGINPRHLVGQQSWGIHGMYERVHHFGGELKISGAPAQGTTLVLQLPLRGSHDV